MRKPIAILRMAMVFVLLAGIETAFGQEMITGIAVDSATLAALPSVNVQIKGAQRGTYTDANGKFSIQAIDTDTLIFSLVGYETLELPLHGYEAGMIRLAEKYTMLQAITIDEFRRRDLYEGMFDERNAELKKSIPFYFSKAKKEKIKVQMLEDENVRVQTYVDVVVTDPGLKRDLMRKHSLTEKEYYDILRAFNETHYRVMYYLTRAELISLLNTFFDAQATAHR